MVRHRIAALWLIFCSLLAIFNICTIYIFDGADWPFYAVVLNFIISSVGVLYHMRVDVESRKRSHLMMVVLRLFLALNSILVFPYLFLSVFTLSGEYHNPLTPDATVISSKEIQQARERVDKDMAIFETKGLTEDLYVYYPDYDRISYAVGERPSRDDKSVLLCVAAAFQSTYQLEFSEDNIVGWHTSNGRLERGAPQDDLGAFTYVNGVAHIWDTDEAESAVREAAEKGGYGYQSFVILKDGVRGGFNTHEFRCFRVLTILDGRVSIIDARTLTHFNNFVQALKEFGVKDAIYCDMGSGWNYSWFRDADGQAKTIIGMPWPFSHNWLAFVKDAE